MHEIEQLDAALDRFAVTAGDSALPTTGPVSPVSPRR